MAYWERLVKRAEDKAVADSREAAAKELLPDQQAARMERQAPATPTNPDVTPVTSQAALYPNWVQAPITKPQGSDQPRPYKMPRQQTDRNSALEEELDTKSVFDPLASQSTQPSDSQPSSWLDTTTGAAGPKM